MSAPEDSSQNLTEPPPAGGLAGPARPVPPPSATPAPPSGPDAETFIPPSEASSAEATLLGDASPHVAGPSIPDRLGPYQLLGELGRGGMGVVFRARHTTLGTECAVKVLIAGEHASQDSIVRFHREAAGVARLGKHPHIVHVFDLGWQGPIAYYAMELIAGRSLRDRLRDRLLEPREAAILLEKVSRALHFAHEHGLVHRDVKPNNILLREDGEPQVVDFGLARDLGSEAHISVTGDIMGTPEYMAPEQAGGQVEATDGRTDVYAVGAVLYECLTGIPPHRGSSWPELLEKILAGDVVPPRRLRSAVPRDLETICVKCLEARREKRYLTAAALADDLARFVAGEPVHARPVSGIERLRRRAVRHWRVVLPTAVAILVVVGALSLLALSRLHASGALAAALELGRRYRDEHRPRAARDAFQEARLLDALNAEATDGLAWADAELTRMDRDAKDAVDTLEASRRVMRVLGRWGRLYRPLRQMELCAYGRISLETIREKNARAWAEVDRFMRDTPDDPASQAAMKALAGWARRLAGYPDEGVALMREAARIDPNVPYGPLMEALVHFSRCVSCDPMPEVTVGESGVEVGAAPAPPQELIDERACIPALLEQARKARILGEEGAEGFAVAVKAMDAMQNGQYADAEGFLDDALGRAEMRSFETGLTFARGRARYLRKDLDGAIDDLRAVCEARPNQPEAWLILGEAMYAKALRTIMRREDGLPGLHEALAAFDKAQVLEPDGHAAFNNRASVWSSIGDEERAAGRSGDEAYRKALADFDEVVRRAPGIGATHNNRGNLFVRMGEAAEDKGEDALDLYRRARGEYDEAIKVWPEYGPAHLNRGHLGIVIARAAAARGEDGTPAYDEALADYDAALRLQPGNPSTLVGRALLWFDRGETEEGAGRDPRPSFRNAIDDFDSAIAASPDYRVALIGRPKVYLRLGAAEASREGGGAAWFQKAFDEADRLVQADPKDWEALEARGLAHIHLGDDRAAGGTDPSEEFRRAEADFQAALAAGAALGPLQRQIGKARMALAGYQEAHGVDALPTVKSAIEAYEASLRARPRRGPAWVELAIARQNLVGELAVRGMPLDEECRAAIAAFDEVLKGEPDYADMHFRRGKMRLLLAQGIDESLAGAEADFAEAIRILPESAESHQGLAEAYHRRAMFEMEEGKDATETFERCLAEMDQALRISPSILTCRVSRAAVLQALARMRISLGKDPGDLFDRSLADAKEAVRIGPDQAMTHVALGDAWLGCAKAAARKGEDPREPCGRAIEAFAAALARDPSMTDAHLYRGLAYEMLHDPAGAVKAFEAVLAAQPESEVARRHLANAKDRLAFAGAPQWRRDGLEGTIAIREGDYVAARPLLENAVAGADASVAKDESFSLGSAQYNLACIHALLSTGRSAPDAAPAAVSAEEAARERDEAFAHLEKAIALDVCDEATLRGDADLATLHDDPRWKVILERLPKK